MLDLGLKDTVSDKTFILGLLKWTLVLKALHAGNVRERAKFYLVYFERVPLTLFRCIGFAGIPPIPEITHVSPRFSPLRLFNRKPIRIQMLNINTALP